MPEGTFFEKRDAPHPTVADASFAYSSGYGILIALMQIKQAHFYGGERAMQQWLGAFRKWLAFITMAAVLTGGLLSVAWSMGLTSHASERVETNQDGYLNRPDTSIAMAQDSKAAETVFLPLLAQSYPLPPPIFGTEMKSTSPQYSGLASDAGVNWLRFPAFDWDRIQPTRTSTYDWQTVDEVSLRNAAAEGLQIIGTIKFTPEWAQKVTGSFCGPIKQDALEEYAQFLTALVKRYSQEPYNIQYWELGNEPDVDPAWVEPRQIFGCWGDVHDPYYGGGYYAEMLKVAYPAIKAADPRAQVLIGGLLLDCDPTHPPQDKNCKPAKFLEGILRNGGGSYFDIVGFHGYPLYAGNLKWEELDPTWAARGGVVLGRIDFLREVMATYDVDKPLMHTEGGLLCHPNSPFCNPPEPEFYQQQADYVIWLFVRNWAQGLKATIWYHFEDAGWRYSGLLDENQQPKPAYDALKFLAQELDGATYEKAITRYPGLRAYEFSASGKKVWVLWSPDEQPQVISLPENADKAYDKYGMSLTPVEGEVTVKSPIYVELTP